MSNFFKNHYEKVLVGVGVLFLLIMVFSVLWSVSFLSDVFGNAFNSNNNGGQGIHFNLEGAKSLNLNVSQ